jgi:hypothetical protein
MDEDIRQRDLSDKRVDEMTPEERREMKRRFQEFFSQVRSDNPPAQPTARKRVRRWDPTTDVRRSSGAR